MKKKKFLIHIFIIVATSHLVKGEDASTGVITPKNISDSPRKLYSKSYIERFSNSWRIYAKANDIAKREKLKKALVDALDSIDNSQRKEKIVNIDTRTVQRIKHAASLLKQFKQMEALSKNVKKTLQTYNEAKNNLSEVARSNDGLSLLKKFLVVHRKNLNDRKRDNIPTTNRRSFIEQVIEGTDDNMKLENPQYLKRTSKVTLKAAPIGKKGEIGMEFSSVDPETSSFDRASKAFNAAKIILHFVKKYSKSNNSQIFDVIDKIHTDIDKTTSTLNENKRKSAFPTLKKDSDIVQTGLTHINRRNNSDVNISGNTASSFMEDLIVDEDNDVVTGAQRSEVLTSTNSTSSNKTAVRETNSINESIRINPNKLTQENSTKKRLNPYVELLKQFMRRKKVNKTSLESEVGTKKDTTPSMTSELQHDSTSKKNDTEDKNKVSDELEKSEENSKSKTADTAKSTSTQTEKGELKSIEDEVLLKKQQDTIRRLKEAKLARQKYEIAKHELAEKVKELYMLANDYEKQETSDQILEVKNFISVTPEKDVSGPNVKRDHDHPGIALSRIQNHDVGKISTNNSDDEKHKGFTMGAIDKTQHQVDVEESKPTTKVSKVYDLGLPSDAKIEDLEKNSGKKSQNQEETLKVIAQAIQEDMDEISSNEKKKKLLTSSLTISAGKSVNATSSSGVKGAKKGGPPADAIDEYLTKALADIMGNDSKTAPAESDKDTKDKDNTDEKNRKIVEKAMKQHANNPDVSLPLVQTNGDKMVLNKDGKTDNTNKTDEARKSNDVFAHVTDRDKTQSSSIDTHDPSNKALLDKASHMEEQVATAQDKLYSNTPTSDPAPAPNHVEYTPPPRQLQQPSPSSDPYGSIQEHAEQSQPQMAISSREEEEEEGPERDDGEDEDEDYHERHHRHRHKGHHFEPEEDEHEEDEEDEPEDEEDEDDDEEDDDKKSDVRYRDERARKRTLHSTNVSNRTSIANTSDTAKKDTDTVDHDTSEEALIEELEDTKKSFVPTIIYQNILPQLR